MLHYFSRLLFLAFWKQAFDSSSRFWLFFFLTRGSQWEQEYQFLAPWPRHIVFVTTSPLDTPHLASQSWDLFHHESKKSFFEYKTLCLRIWLNCFPGLLSHCRCPMTWVLCHNYGACQGWQQQGKQFWVGGIIVYAQSAQVTIGTIFTSVTYQF